MLVYKSIIEPFCAFGDFKIKNKILKIIINFVNVIIKLIEKINVKLIKFYQFFSTENYSIIINQKGEGYSKYKDIQINRFRNRIDCHEGIGVYFKNTKTKSAKPTFFIKKKIGDQTMFKSI